MATNGIEDASLLNSLKFLREQLRSGEATPAIKALVNEMLIKGKVFAAEAAPASPVKGSEATSAEKKEKKEKKKDKGAKAAEYEAECLSCLEERVGRFYRRGFKCNWCAGTEEGTKAKPVSSEPAYVPSSEMKRGFVTLSVDNDAAMQLQPSPSDDDDDDGDVGGAKNGGLADDDDGGGNPSIVVDHAGHTKSRDRVTTNPVDSVDAGDSELPDVRYGVSVFKYAPGDEARSQRHAGCVVPAHVAARRTAYHPTLLYAYTMTRDDAAHELTVVTESARLLKVRGAVLGRRGPPHYELIMQVALSALHAMQYLKATFQTAHGDLRPYNFFVDAHHNVKLRHAPFVTDGPMPSPFCAPEDDEDLGAERPAHADAKQAPYARDMYALGITLTIIAYGEPSLPAIGDVVGGAEETALVRFIEPMLRDNPNERCTISDALASRFHSTIRVVNGVPMESSYCRIDVRSSDGGSGGSGDTWPDRQMSSVEPAADTASEAPPSPQGLLTQPPGADARASPMSMSSGRNSFRFGGANVMRVPDTPDLLFIDGKGNSPADVSTQAGQRMLSDFLRNGGPMFQVIRTPGHVTVYSVRKDPRRKPNVSFLAASTNSRGDSQSDFGASATSSWAANRRRSI
mmetsp:Transcript_25790/g.79543  ORF Transcript_25790/g.79543 Transcript_25790/m.79543 type:complete len:628 (-) Transcript_25790:110-1993(-)